MDLQQEQSDHLLAKFCCNTMCITNAQVENIIREKKTEPFMEKTIPDLQDQHLEAGNKKQTSNDNIDVET